jgi:hypothetical protein
MANTEAFAEQLAEEIREAIRLDRIAMEDHAARQKSGCLDENRQLASGHVAQVLAVVSRRFKDPECGEFLTEEEQHEISDEIARKLVLPNPSSLRSVFKAAGASHQLNLVSDIRHLIFSVTPSRDRIRHELPDVRTGTP